MEWHDDAIVLGLRKYGENNGILHAFTKEHGRHAALVRGIQSKRSPKPWIRTGNILKIVWRGRLNDQLGSYKFTEPAEDCSPLPTIHYNSANIIHTLIEYLLLLPEHYPHKNLFEEAKDILKSLTNSDISHSSCKLVKFEVLLLEELGFGIDMYKCTISGETNDLAFVSPRTGRAVTRKFGIPYEQKLLKIPKFLKRNWMHVDIDSHEEICNGFYLSGFFLKKHVWQPRKIPISFARTEVINYHENASRRQSTI